MTDDRRRTTDHSSVLCRPSSVVQSERLPNRHAEFSDTLDFALDLVAGDGGRDARWRAGHNDVAGGELDHLRKFCDDLRHVPDHLIEVAVLAHLAVDLEHDAAFRRVADRGCRLERPAWRRIIERLADLPRPLDVARSDLQVATRQVDADAVAIDAGKRVFGLDVAAAAFERHDQLDFVMHVLGQRGVGHRAAVGDDRVRRLGEEERRLAHVLAHLLDVLDIIAADAPQAADRKKLTGAGNRYRSLRRLRNDITLCVGAHEAVSCWRGSENAWLIAQAKPWSKQRSTAFLGNRGGGFERGRLLPKLQPVERGIAAALA